MGTEVDHRSSAAPTGHGYREKVRRCLDVFARMLRESHFDVEDPMTGMEIEFNLVDDEGRPGAEERRGPRGDRRTRLPDRARPVQPRDQRAAAPPRLARGLAAFEDDLRGSLNHAESKANEVGAHMVMIGILPTLEAGHLSPSNDQPEPALQAAQRPDPGGPRRGPRHRHPGRRAAAHDLGVDHARGGVHQHAAAHPGQPGQLRGVLERLPGDQPASSSRSAPTRRTCSASELWHETRIPLFEQATDTRSEELKEQGVRPRVWFGERWITSIFDLFEENVRYFPALLPITEDEDPLEVLEAGGTPGALELRLHNGTIYRWNRPVYDVVDGVPAPAGGEPGARGRADASSTRWPTPPSTSAWCGALAEDERPLWSQMSFSAAEENFHVAAQHGIDARVYWPGIGEVDATELVLRRLLPLAREGPRALGGRARRGRPAARRSSSSAASPAATAPPGTSTGCTRHRGEGTDRAEALRLTLQEYRELMHANEPVHTWPL